MEWMDWPDWIGPGDCDCFVHVLSPSILKQPQDPEPEPESKPLAEREIVGDDGG